MSIISDSLKKIKPSPTIAVTQKARELKAAGKDVIGLGAGEPDFDTPENIKQAAIKAINDGDTKYTAVDGTPALKKAIVEKFKKENNLEYTTDQVTVGAGGKHVIYNAMMATLNEGDEVIVPAPYWVSYPDMVLLAGGTPIILECNEKQGFKINPAELEKSITSKTKWIILNSPSNPTGGVWGEEALIRMLEIAKKHNWIVISDECYERLVYDGEFTSTEKINQDHNINATVITCLSLSKTYAMTGWRIGYSAGPAYIIKAMAKIQGQATSCANSIGQVAGIEALIGSQECVEQMKDAFKRRRDLIVQLLNELPNVHCAIPGGAFYVFPNFEKYLGKEGNGKLLKDTFDISEYILQSAKVVTVPGDGFGAPGHIRFSYATDSETIKEGISRVAKVLKRII